MIKDRLFDVYLLGSLTLGCVLAAPYVLYLIVREEFSEKL